MSRLDLTSVLPEPLGTGAEGASVVAAYMEAVVGAQAAAYFLVVGRHHRFADHTVAVGLRLAVVMIRRVVVLARFAAQKQAVGKEVVAAEVAGAVVEVQLEVGIVVEVVVVVAAQAVVVVQVVAAVASVAHHYLGL